MSYETRDLALSECDQAGKLLAEAFRNDPAMRSFLPNEQHYDRVAPWMFSSWARWSILYGKAWTTPGLEGVALRRKPGQDRDNLWRYFRSGMLKTPKVVGQDAFHGLNAFAEHTARMRPEIVGSRRYWYAWTIGVRPNKQGQGIGKALMQRTFAAAQRDGLPCCLETATEKDLAIHGSQGYELRKTWHLPNSGLPIYLMVRPARNGR